MRPPRRGGSAREGPDRGVGGRGQRPWRGAMVAQQPVGLPLQPALLGRGAPPADHRGRACARRWIPGPASAFSRSAPGPATTRSRSPSGSARTGGWTSSTSSRRCSTTRCAAPASAGSPTSPPPRATPRACPTRTRASTPPTSSPCSARSPTRTRRCASCAGCCKPGGRLVVGELFARPARGLPGPAAAARRGRRPALRAPGRQLAGLLRALRRAMSGDARSAARRPHRLRAGGLGLPRPADRRHRGPRARHGRHRRIPSGGSRRARPSSRACASSTAAEAFWERAGELDLVVVASPNRTHVPLARAALEAGLPVVVDKPLAATAAEAAALVEAAAAAGVLAHRLPEPPLGRRLPDPPAAARRGRARRRSRFESRFERWRPACRKERGASAATRRRWAGCSTTSAATSSTRRWCSSARPAHVYAEVDAGGRGAAVDDDTFIALAHARRRPLATCR